MLDIGIMTAKSKFSELIFKVKDGEEVIIRDKGKKIARIIPFYRHLKKRKIGTALGKIKIHGDINAPLPDSIIEDFYK